MKLIKWLLGIIVVVVIMAVSIVAFSLDAIVKAGVEKIGPQVTGVDVTLESVKFSLVRGRCILEGLLVGNPDGFKTPSAIELGKLRVVMKPMSVFSDEIQIEEIYINAPQITFEGSRKGSNISKLMEQLESGGQEERADPEAGGGRKVVIDNVIIENARVKLSMTALDGIVAPVSLPRIHLQDIGKESGGASIAEAASEILGALAGSIFDGVAKAGVLLAEGAQVLGDAALDRAGALGEVALDGAGVLGEAALEGAGIVGDAAGRVAKGAGEAARKVGGGARKLIGGLPRVDEKDD